MSAQNMADAFAPVEDLNRRIVAFNTWGHLYPEPGKSYTGHIDFICGGYQAVDCQPCSIHFVGLQDSPELYEDVTDFTMEGFSDNEEYASIWGRKYLSPGLYRWSGTYRKCKNGAAKFEKGRITLIHPFRSPPNLPLRSPDW